MGRLAISTDRLIDPVCGMSVVPGRVALVTEYRGCSYYFCDESCRIAFESDPGKYLNPLLNKRKGWWGRFLERMIKANQETFGTSGPPCH
ncbi:YHS domain-containing protein [Thermodesulfobacteriota bacterium]